MDRRSRDRAVRHEQRDVDESRDLLIEYRCDDVEVPTDRGSDRPRKVGRRLVLDTDERARRVSMRKTVYQRIRSGSMVPESCVICGSDDRVEAHHVRYTDDGEIEWLCHRHHVATFRTHGWRR
jgi:hypothetical protein